ncbi:conserved hypothetical protein [Methylocella silvestris BL2]|uniref:Lysophospholipase n=1 Tax=Methylocella silvestris (strain DSM 15510 / CIP 108128 / LMG 27833 / NCIMB 13906 / BL2) TaxID=395965 RepID=B8EP69_METSB|nr:lysophospholipase [Methylocella silvestris]ACK49657.1 conserved hypothetical protein [Methylocella silvestris BL2]
MSIRRKPGARCAFLAAAILGLTAPSQGDAQTKLPRNTFESALVLQDEGTFFVNGKVVTTAFPDAPATGAPTPGKIMIDQMYVHYRIPIFAKKYPIIMVHGGGLTGQTYETTPDGREGWATYFARNGYSVYVVDFPGRGRAGFDPSIINQAKLENNASLLPAIRRTTEEAAWTTFRFGPALGVTYPGLQYPVKNVDGFDAQGVPYTEVTLQGGALTQGPQALVALLDQLGPAILLVHSQSGPFADAVVGLRPDLVKAVVNIEGNQLTIPTAQQIAAYRGVPDIELFGDNVIGNPASTGQDRLNGRTAVSKAINAAGGRSEVVQLPMVGLHGNCHMMMQDKNNLKVADYLMKWLKKNVKFGRNG